MTLLLLLQLLAGPEAAMGSIAGVVLDATTRQPIAGAPVRLPDLERAAVTDSLGRYRLEGVPAGPQHLTLKLMGYAPRTVHALVPRQGVLEINLALDPRPLALRGVAVGAPVAMRGAERGVTRFPDREVSSGAIANHPLLAEPDALHALGGGEVSIHPETPGGLYVRGGSTDQTAYQLDGVPVLSPYHAGGLTTAWNSDALARVYLWDTEPSPAPADALSGTVEGVTREPGDALRAQGAVSTTQSRLTLDGPLGRAGAGFVLSGRAGVHDLLSPSGERSYLAGGIGDVLGKLEAPALGGRLRALGYGNTNRISTAALAQETPPARPRNLFDWTSESYGLEWRREIPSLGRLRALGWSAGGDASAGWAMPTGRIDLDASRRDRGAMLAWERGGVTASAAGATAAPTSPLSSLELRLEGSHTSYHVVPDSAGARWDLDARNMLATVAARRAQGLGAGFDADASVSVTRAHDANVRAAPRARLGWKPSDRLATSLAYVRTYQSAQSLRNAESVVEHVFPADVTMGAGAAGIPVAYGDQRVLGLDWRFAPGMRLGLQAYDRVSHGVVLVAPRDGEPFSTGAFVVGETRARGASIDVAAGSARWGALASYGWQRVRERYGADSSYVPEHAAAHLIQGGIVLFPTLGSAVKLGVDAALGRRVTEIPGALDWESCNLLDRGCEFGGSPHYGDQPLGASPLPAYARVDLGVRQHWHVAAFGHETQVALFATYSNLLSRHNLLTYARDPVSGARVPIELRPASPLVVGLDGRF